MGAPWAQWVILPRHAREYRRKGPLCPGTQEKHTRAFSMILSGYRRHPGPWAVSALLAFPVDVCMARVRRLRTPATVTLLTRSSMTALHKTHMIVAVRVLLDKLESRHGPRCGEQSACMPCRRMRSSLRGRVQDSILRCWPKQGESLVCCICVSLASCTDNLGRIGFV